jgi:hypothetical protein
MSASPSRRTAGTLQLAGAWILVAERLVAALSLTPSREAYYGALLIVGVLAFWPPLGRHGLPQWLRESGGATMILVVFGPLWRGLWTEALAPGLSSPWADVVPWLLLAGLLSADRHAVRRVLLLLRVELLKLAVNRLVRVGLLAVAAVGALAGWAHEPLPGETAWGTATAALGAGFAAAQVFVLVLGAVAIAGEASQGTLKMILPHAYRRSDWVLAKGFSLALVALAFAVLASLVAVLAGLAAGPLGDVTLTAEGFGDEVLVTVHATGADMRSHLGDAVLAQALALVAVGALGLFVSCLITGVVGALCTAFLAFAALKLGDLVLGLDADTLRRVFLWPPERLREVTLKLGQGLSEAWDARLPAVSLLLSLACAALCVLVGIRLFGRRDLHV